MQIPILNGIYTDEDADFRTSYPVNLIPVPKQQGISKGYLRPADGIIAQESGPGVCRSGINWNGVCYRVLGTKLVSISSNGTVTTIDDVGSGTQCPMDYSFDYLGVISGTNFYIYNGTTLQQVTDTDLGNVIDFIWVDGFFLLTDGVNLIVTELNDPFSVNPTKYGSSEADPDPVKATLKLRNEPYVLNRYTTEVFENIGGLGFPFQRIEGAQIQRGTIGTHTCCVFADAIAFMGSGRNESPAIWLGSDGSSVKLSTREIDQILENFTEAQLSESVLEPRVDKSHQFLYVHLPDRTLVYDHTASLVVKEPVWFVLSSSVDVLSQYTAINLVWCYDKWLVGDPASSRLGYLTDSVSTHWGGNIGWEFATLILYNEGYGAIIHELELVALTGRVSLDDDPLISAEYSLDGETWSQPKYIYAGKQGNRRKRLVWLSQGAMRQWRIQRFKGNSDAFLSFARLQAKIEGLNG